MTNSYGSRDTVRVGGKSYDFFRLGALDKAGIRTTHLPFCLKILLENLLRTEDGKVVRAEDIRALAGWNPKAEPSREIASAETVTALPPLVVSDASVTPLGSGYVKRVTPLSRAGDLVAMNATSPRARPSASAAANQATRRLAKSRTRRRSARAGRVSIAAVEPATQVSSRARSAALCHRSSGSFARHRRTT